MVIALISRFRNYLKKYWKYPQNDCNRVCFLQQFYNIYIPLRQKVEVIHLQMTSKLNSKHKNSLYLTSKQLQYKMVDTKNKNTHKKQPVSMKYFPISNTVPFYKIDKFQDYQISRMRASQMILNKSLAKDHQNMNASYAQILQKSTIKHITTETTEDDFQIKATFPKRNDVVKQNDQVWQDLSRKPIKSQTSICAVSNNFVGSFRIVLTQLVQAYFLQVFLKNKIKYMTFQIWNYVIKMSGVQLDQANLNQYHNHIETKIFSQGISKIFGNQFKKNQTEQIVKRYFTNKQNILYLQFQKFMAVQNDFMGFLVQRPYQKKYGSLATKKMVNIFFKVLIELADLQKKLRLICTANQTQFIKFVLSISAGQFIKVPKLANFLEQKKQQLTFGLRLTQDKLTNFLDRTIGHKHTKYQFMKWLKVDQRQT